MSFQEEIKTPSIKVCLSPVFSDDAVLLDVLSGVEEESIPYELVQGELEDATPLAYLGALNAALEVGIGVDSKGYVAVHYKKLPEDQPLFLINYKNEPEKVRSICSNAARLVKGTPFILDETLCPKEVQL